MTTAILTPEALDRLEQLAMGFPVVPPPAILVKPMWVAITPEELIGLVAMARQRIKDAELVEAVRIWASDREGHVEIIPDAELMKALWTHDGDHVSPCPECDGECDEPCAPKTVSEAHAELDRFIAKERERISAEHSLSESIRVYPAT